MRCPRCGGREGPRVGSTCPGCWATCKAKFGPEELAPCGKAADAPSLLYGKVRVCQRHYGLFMGAHLAQAREVALQCLGPQSADLVDELLKEVRL